MGYLHVDIMGAQGAKRRGQPCGDLVETERTPSATVLVCSDGLGSGIKANLAATFCTARLLELTRRGHSLQEAFTIVARSMNEARGSDMPYAAFAVARFRSDGETTVLSYEMPPPLYVTRRTASVLPQQTRVWQQAIVGESHCYVEPQEGVLLVSDGITQAGLGHGLALGWTSEGLCQYVNSLLASGTALGDVPMRVFREARRLWGPTAGDDCTSVLALCRKGRVVNILTGPPAHPSRDNEVAQRFLSMEGAKVVCGATTAKVVATYLGKKVDVIQDQHNLIAPPQYRIEGLDLVTEGAVTLNQAHNLLEENCEQEAEDSGVTELCAFLRAADRVNFFVGGARNVAGDDVGFRQQGILPRATIVRLLTELLRKDGKLVVQEFF